MVLLLAFSVKKKPTTSLLAYQIRESDYDEVFEKWKEMGVTYLYKMVHKYNDEGKPHLHFHGLFYTTHYVQFKDLMILDYSFDFKKDNINEDWHSYCHHEDETKLKKLNEQIVIHNFHQATKRRKVKQQSINSLLKIVIYA